MSPRDLSALLCPKALGQIPLAIKAIKGIKLAHENELCELALKAYAAKAAL